MGQQRNHHVFQQCQLAKDFRRLEYARNTQLVDLVRLHTQHASPIKVDLAVIGNQLTNNGIEQSRFTGTIGSDNRMHRALIDTQVHIVQRL